MTLLPADLQRFLRKHRLRVSRSDTEQVWASRNLTLVCRRASKRLFVKAGDEATRFEASLLPRLAALRVPKVFAAEGAVVALEWLEGRTLFSRRDIDDEALGAAIAEVHALDVAALPARACLGDFGARIVWTSPHSYAGLSAGGLALFGAVQRDLEATRRLAWLFEQEERSCFVHADLRQANVMITATGPVLLDWELAGRGDPARDLGMLIADDFAAYLVPNHAPARQSAAEFRRHARGLLRGYGAARGAHFHERIIGWMAEALLRRAHTVAQHEARFESAEQHLVAVACALLREPTRWARSYLPPAKQRNSLSLRKRGEGRGEGPNSAETRGVRPAKKGAP